MIICNFSVIHSLPLCLLQLCVRTAARTVGAALGPTDVPVSTVSLGRSAREVRARPRFYGDTVCYDSPVPMLHRYGRGSRVRDGPGWFFGGKTKGFYKNEIVILQPFHSVLLCMAWLISPRVQ